MPLTSNVKVQFSGQQTLSLDPGTGQQASAPISLLLDVAMASGILDSQADLVWGRTRNILASANDDLDLRGVLLDAFGAVLNFVEVVGVLVYALPTNVNNVVVGAAPSNAFVGPNGAATHTRAIKPGGIDCWFAPAGWATTAATADLLRIANGGAGTPVDYAIIILGRSA